MANNIPGAPKVNVPFQKIAPPDLAPEVSKTKKATTNARLKERLGFGRTPALDYVDPDYPAADNPTTVWRMSREAWGEGS